MGASVGALQIPRDTIDKISSNMSTKNESKSTLYYRRFYLAGIVISACWAIFVVFQYISVGRTAAYKPSYLLSSSQVSLLILLSLLVLSTSISIGYILTTAFYKKIVAGILVGLIIAMTGYYKEVINHQWSFLFETIVDGLRAFILIMEIAIVGLGLFIGTRLNHTSIQAGEWLILAALPFLFISFYSHKAGAVLGLLWIFLVAYWIGSWFHESISSLLKKNIEHNLLLAVASGMALLILLFFFLGLLGYVSISWIIATLLLLTLVFGIRVKKDVQAIIQIQWDRIVFFTISETFSLFIFTALFIIYFICALAPEVGADALALRIFAPNIWLKLGEIVGLPTTMGSYNFYAGEILHLIALPLMGFSSAKLLQFGFSVLLIYSSIFDVYKGFKKAQVILWLIPFWGSTLIWWQMSWGFVDITQLFFFYGSILSVQKWLKQPDNYGWLVISGILGATATLIKLSGIITLITSLALVGGYTLYKRNSPQIFFSRLRMLILSFFIVLLPMFFRAYLITGNPIFPFLNEVFQSPLAPLKNVVFHYGVGLKFPEILSVFWGIFFDPLIFGSLGSYHPLIIILLICGIAGLYKENSAGYIWLFSAMLAYFAWVIIEQNSRYSFMAFYALTLGMGFGIENIGKDLKSKIFNNAFHIVTIVILIWGIYFQFLKQQFWMGTSISGELLPVDVTLGDQTDVEYLTNRVPTYFCADWLNSHYGENAQVWQMPSIRQHLYFNSTTFSIPHSIPKITTPLYQILHSSEYESVYRTLRNLGYTHILYNASSAQYANISESNRDSLLNSQFEDKYLYLECADRGIRLYKINEGSASEPDRDSVNLIKNAQFTTLTLTGELQSWQGDQDFVVYDDESLKVLEFKKSRIFQLIPVSENSLYDLTVDYKKISADSDAIVQINWLDAEGNLKLFWKEKVYPTNQTSSYHYYQTAPLGVKSAIIYLYATDIIVNQIDFQAINH